MSGYSNFVIALGELIAGETVVDATSATPYADDDLNTILPSIIADAEGMMYRDPDLDFLNTRVTDTTQTTTSGQRSLPIPAGMLIVEQALLYSPAGTTSANGTAVPLIRSSVEYINTFFPDAMETASPVYGSAYFAIFDNANILIGPTPDNSYQCAYYGVKQQTPLSYTNTDTILTNFYADLFLSAAMIFTSGWMKNFSAAGADNPPQAISWKSHYDELKQGAAFQSARQKFLSSGSTPYPPVPQNQGTR
jgi:hypothetical protein